MLKKGFAYISIGILFGIIMTKSEAVSWFRILEMFRFESFHMFGIIGTAVTVGVISVFLIKKFELKDITGQKIEFQDKNWSIPRYLIGGIIFGLGWAMTGACPGPMYTLLGHGMLAILVVIASALLGTFLYGYFRDKLPH